MTFTQALSFSSLLTFVWSASPAHAQTDTPPPGVHTTRDKAKGLVMPKDDASFHFLIYGDRTGGPPEGLKVLSQAVADTNLLSPDFVMTVGDLVNGYTDAAKWQDQANEYSAIMKDLKMPWFPIAGNHDIYWRGPNRPPTEHEADFERHFGPLWFWFQHKGCGFIGLYSDEGDATKGAREFTRPEQTLMSPVQMEWLKKSLGEMKSLKQIFVFLHHPRWIEKNYPGTNWKDVHKLLVDAGNVKAVFAGHIHRLHYGGNRDGIEYYALAATGASMPGVYPGAGYIHHMNLVTVRDNGQFAVSVLPVGQVLDHKLFTPERQEDIDLARKVSPKVFSPKLKILSNGQGGGVVEMEISNPCKEAIEVNLLPENDPAEWFFAPDHLHVNLPAGETVKLQQTVVRILAGFTEGKLSMPSLKLETEYLDSRGVRVPLPPRSFTIAAGLAELPTSFFAATKNQAVQLDGKSAYRVDMTPEELPDGPFTVEAWICPSGKQSAPFLAKTEQSEYSLDLQNNVPGFHCFIGGKYHSALAQNFTVTADTWVHIAGVFTGTEVQLYVDGKLLAHEPATGTRTTNALPLYIGADPDAKSLPTRPFKGGMDEIRISSKVRYTADFTPEARFTTDADTLHLYHCDQTLGGFMPSDSVGGRYAIPTGKPELKER